MLNKKGPKIELCGTPYIVFQGMREIDFKVEEAWNTEKYCRPPWLVDKKNF